MEKQAPDVFGFAVERMRSGTMCVTPATKTGDKVRCHDISGFMGSWDMQEQGVFFPGETPNDCLCPVAMQKADEYARSHSEEPA